MSSAAAILDEILKEAVRRHSDINHQEGNKMETNNNNNNIVKDEDESKRPSNMWSDGKLPDSLKIREKLKSMPSLKKDQNDRKSRGPMIAKPCIVPVTCTAGQSTHNTSSASSSSSSVRSTSPVTSSRVVRTPSPTSTSTSAFQRHVVNRPRSPSFKYRSNGSRTSSGRRTPSPGAVDHAPSEEEASRRVEKALRARLYLLQQPGPNSFLIGGDSPSHKFRVIIGPQTCSCGRGRHCIHVLFIMLRVLQVPNSDPALWAKTLKNYEVEALLQSYHTRRSKKSATPLGPSSDTHQNRAAMTSSTESLNSNTSGAREEDSLCPICLLEMIDGESLVQCEGCRNRLHHHCISVWFEECRSQGERLNCPLCRGEWTIKQIIDSPTEAEEDLSREDAVSPQPANEDLPYCDVIPAELMDKSRPWIKVFGEDLVACVHSKDWSVREKSMSHFRKRCIKYLTIPRDQDAEVDWEMVGVGFDIIDHVCADPVYRVFVAALKGLRCLISHLVCRDQNDVHRLEQYLESTVDTLLMKCADSNRRTSQLALSTLEELCKNQDGELALGHKLDQQASLGIDSLRLIVDRILLVYPHNSVHWQWLLGRLVAAERVLDLHGGRLLGQGRLTKIANFALNGSNNGHINIGRQSRRVFIQCARLCAHKTDVFKLLEDMLDESDKHVQGRMRRRLNKVVSEFSVAQRAVKLVQHEPAYDKTFEDRQTSPTPPFPTPEDSPRTPETFDYDVSSREDGDGGQPTCQRLLSDESSEGTLSPSISADGDSRRDVSFRTEVTSPKRQPKLAGSGTKPCRDCFVGSSEDSVTNLMHASLLRRLAGQILDKNDMKCGEYVEGRDWVKGPVLGTGAFSTCYQVRDVKTGEIMALKQITFCPDSDSDQEKAVKAIKSELSLSLKLDHANVLRILGATQEDNRFNMFAEWMPGGSVASLLEKFGSFSEQVTCGYTRQILSGLVYLHDNHIVHRDLKGANLLVSSDGQKIRIADFGASAKLATRSTLAGELKGQFLGTIAFMAPEILRGESYGRSCDIWSVACVVIEMITCQPPWGAKDVSNHLALIYKIASATGPPPIPEHVSSHLADFLSQCFRRNPAERPSALQLQGHDALCQRD